MAEFKAQILGILIVLGVFGILAAGYKTLVQNTMNTVTNEVSEQLSDVVG